LFKHSKLLRCHLVKVQFIHKFQVVGRKKLISMLLNYVLNLKETPINHYKIVMACKFFVQCFSLPDDLSQDVNELGCNVRLLELKHVGHR